MNPTKRSHIPESWQELVSAMLYKSAEGLTDEGAVEELGYDPEAIAREWLKRKADR